MHYNAAAQGLRAGQCTKSALQRKTKPFLASSACEQTGARLPGARVFATHASCRKALQLAHVKTDCISTPSALRSMGRSQSVHRRQKGHIQSKPVAAAAVRVCGCANATQLLCATRPQALAPTSSPSTRPTQTNNRITRRGSTGNGHPRVLALFGFFFSGSSCLSPGATAALQTSSISSFLTPATPPHTRQSEEMAVWNWACLLAHSFG
jgi:hypothetical protein